MNPGLTVRPERSITCAPRGRLTDCAILIIRLPSTEISLGPFNSSEVPSNTFPHTSTVVFISVSFGCLSRCDPRVLLERLFWRARYGKMPSSLHGHKPESKAEDYAGCFCQPGGKLQHSSHH